MHAAFGGNAELCKLLIERGADVNSNLHSQGVRDKFRWGFV